MPPWTLPLTPARVCRLRMLTPRTTMRCSSGTVRSTTPRLPRSLPAMTTTVSPALMSRGRTRPCAHPWCTRSILMRRCRRRPPSTRAISEHLRGEADDLHEVALAQLTGDGPEDAGAAGVVLGGDQHRGVLIEADVTAVGA